LSGAKNCCPAELVHLHRNKSTLSNNYNNSLTNLGTLPGGISSAAYAINDQGQIVGVSTSSSGSRAFIYENGVMKDMGIPYTGDPEKREGIDINNVGQAVVTSSAGGAFIYQNGVVTNVNDWLTPEVVNLGYTVTEAKGINDLGYIIAQGTKSDGVNHGLLLIPTFKNVNRNINVGNISTFGETVLLEGAEVYLEGQSIVTQGGKIESNGKTIVNSNLVIDSSITDEYVGNPNADSVISQSGVKVAGGDVLFTDTVNTNSTGDQNLTLKAGAGDIAFKNTVGDTNPVFNLTVEGAGSLTTTGKDLTVDNELKLEVINDIATANISAQGLIDISLGTIGEESFASSGNFATGNIEALSLEVANNGNFTAGNITTSNGDLDVISLNQLTVGQLSATNGTVDLISGTKGIKVGGTAKGDNGFIAVARLDIVTNQITSSEDAVILKSSQGAVTVNGSVTAFDEISLAAAGNVTVGAVTSNDQSVTLISATGIVNSSGAVLGIEDVTIASAKSLTIDQKIQSKFGTIDLVSTAFV
jgi:probable HAF family extracellular repeat protein